MFNCKLTRLSTIVEYDDNNKPIKRGLRTSEVLGLTKGPPTLGAPFDMMAVGLTEGTTRLIATSLIKNVTDLGNSKYQFKTQNSEYEVELYDEV